MEDNGKKAGFFKRLFNGLGKTRQSITGSLSRLFSDHDRIDDEFYEDLEELMIMGDMGIRTTDAIIASLKEKVEEQRIKDPAQCRDILINSIKEKMAVKETDYAFEHETSVILVIGVNGTGKTTTAGKLASQLKSQGRRVILAAADTFRAAACEQLREWSSRAGVDLIAGQAGADPASVVYDAVAAAKARRADVLICDTAGRLHNKKNLMDELHKIYRVITREFPEAHLETLLVLDGTTGQNALVQARDFSEAAKVTGIVLTKLDGTAKGGIAVAIQNELQVPVKYIGIGETLEDLQKFDSDAFVDALFKGRQEEDDE
ncbi:MAG: signal recognition particle-docking protein FtsY [Lachnospiraceae bacterium]|nr:signal recognition particle-docking protein FtsY [Lachnospiraceae bacterium]